MSVKNACKEAGVHPSLYYIWRKTPKPRKKPEHQTIILPLPDNRIFFFSGLREDLERLVEVMKGVK